MSAAFRVPGPPMDGIKGRSSGTDLSADQCLQKCNLCCSNRLLFDAFSKHIYVLLLWFKSNYFTRLSETSKCCRTTEREISVIGTNIEYSAEPRQCRLQPRIELVLIDSKHLSHRVPGIHDGNRTA